MKTSKKLNKVVAALVAAAALFTFGACKQHDDDDDDTAATLLLLYAYQHQEVAKFEATVDETMGPQTISFVRDGTVSRSFSGSDFYNGTVATGTYTGDPTKNGTVKITTKATSAYINKFVSSYEAAGMDSDTIAAMKEELSKTSTGEVTISNSGKTLTSGGIEYTRK